MSNKAKFLLRLGLAFTFAYAGLAALMSPTSWVGYVPQWVSTFVSQETFLLLHAIFELALAAAILFKFKPRYAYALAALDLLAILIFSGIDAITFRDVGLFFMALALWVTSTNN